MKILIRENLYGKYELRIKLSSGVVAPARLWEIAVLEEAPHMRLSYEGQDGLHMIKNNFESYDSKNKRARVREFADKESAKIAAKDAADTIKFLEAIASGNGSTSSDEEIDV